MYLLIYIWYLMTAIFYYQKLIMESNLPRMQFWNSFLKLLGVLPLFLYNSTERSKSQFFLNYFTVFYTSTNCSAIARGLPLFNFYMHCIWKREGKFSTMRYIFSDMQTHLLTVSFNKIYWSIFINCKTLSLRFKW